MRIARYLHKGKEQYGILIRDQLISLPNLAKKLTLKLPSNLEKFIMLGDQAIELGEKVQSHAEDYGCSDLYIKMPEVSILAPIVKPGKIVCLGLNYLDHAKETGKSVPQEPILFMKPRTALIGPKQRIVKPSFVRNLDYEGELAIVIGKKGRNISISEASKHVFGYTVFNDISAREIQFGDGQWTRGKGFDTFAPIGPWVVTRNQLSMTDNLCICTWVNEELRQNSSTRNMAFKVDEIVHKLSRVMTLEPCDIIATGTPSGVGFAMDPPRFLEDGDVVRVEIEGIGVLENEVCAEEKNQDF